MIKSEIKVPRGIKYISEWGEYVLPEGEHCIVDKGVTGCGYTEFCLTNSKNVVLCSPRKLLLENKSEQHLHDHNILYLENDIKNYQGSKSFENRIRDHIANCQGPFGDAPVKFMVTYDSTGRVVKALQDLGVLQEFIFIIDEMQSLFLDSYFKSSVELDFVEALQACQSAIYLSATPMLDKYLEQLPEFKDLNFYKLNWDATGYVEKIKIQRKRVASLGGECGKIIENFENGAYPMTLDASGRPTQSKEAVFYFNSVTEILRIVKKYGLTPGNTRIICSETTENETKLRKLGFSFGKVPLKGETNPKYLFCTSAIYMGIDLHSDCASSYVFADPNIDSLALDISMDLPQIIGRQRNRNNPFKNNIIVFYRTKRKGEKDLTLEEFEKAQNQRREETRNLLNGFNKLSLSEQQGYLKKIKADIQVSQYSNDFISVSKNTNKPVYNSLIDIANQRAWEVSQKDYQDTLSVTRAFQEAGFDSEDSYSTEEIIAQDFLDNYFYATGVFSEKMRMYCEFCDANGDNLAIMKIIDAKITDPKFKEFYKYYGTKGCSARRYRENELISGWSDITKDSQLQAAICVNFKVDGRYTKAEIKQKLTDIYQNLGINKKAKATDLSEYFKLSKTCITLPDKTTANGFKLGSL